VKGSIPELGSWRERGLCLQHLGDANWGCEMQIESTVFPFTYKYALVPCFVSNAHMHSSAVVGPSFHL